MNTEKYYYGLDLETTKKDSSIIDCEYPGPRPENPSLNTTNTSLLNKVSATSNYTKLVDCPKEFTLTKHNDAITDSSLQVIEQKLLNGNISYNYTISTGTNIIGTPKDVYLAYEDINKIFEGNLSSVMSVFYDTLDSDVTGCSAKLSKADTTGALIKYSLNKCAKDRIITFSYNNLPIFKIKQTYEKKETYYIFYIWSIDNSDGINKLAFFEDSTSLPASFTGSQIKEIIMYMDSISNTSTALFYFCNTSYTLVYTKVSDLKNNGKLKHLQGHDYLNTDSNKYNGLYLHKISYVNTYENYTFSTKTASLSMKIRLYKSRTNDSNTLYKSNDYILFGNTDNVNHVGVYKYILNDN